MTFVIVQGLGFGDEGKGTIVDFLTRRQKKKFDTVWNVRWNGGAQAAHNVVTPEGQHHTFAQFGSGSFAGAKTYLHEDVCINPIALRNEAEHLRSLGVTPRATAAPMCRLTTPWHIGINRLREGARAASGKAHGSCGMGIGETVTDENPLTLADMTTFNRTRSPRERAMEHAYRAWEQVVANGWEPTAEQQDRYFSLSAVMRFVNACVTMPVEMTSPPWTNLLASTNEAFIFEGAQGALLDQDYGFHPHTTWSRCRPQQLIEELAAAQPHKKTHVLGVSRTYSTRHGAGPFPAGRYEELVKKNPHEHNGSSGMQGAFRTGPLDYVLFQYAIDVVGGVDSFAFTCCDVEPLGSIGIYHYSKGTAPDIRMIAPSLKTGAALLAYQEELGRVISSYTPMKVANMRPAQPAPIAILSYGPTANDKVVNGSLPWEVA